MCYVPESNARVLGLINGDFDVISTVPFNQAAMVQSLPEVTLEVQPMYRLDYVYLNHAKPPIDDRNIRLALNHAANREAILQTVYFGYGETPTPTCRRSTSIARACSRSRSTSPRRRS